ncbi:MAG: hypothetical protein V3V08_09770 [Nannocystaceae bacterium]
MVPLPTISVLSRRLRTTALALTFASTGAFSAIAYPKPIPFSYPHATQPQGALELEQFVDMVPVRVTRENDTTTEAMTSVRAVLQTELECGLTVKDRVT